MKRDVCQPKFLFLQKLPKYIPDSEASCQIRGLFGLPANGGSVTKSSGLRTVLILSVYTQDAEASTAGASSVL